MKDGRIQRLEELIRELSRVLHDLVEKDRTVTKMSNHAT